MTSSFMICSLKRNFIRTNKLGRMRWAGHVVQLVNIKNVCIKLCEVFLGGLGVE